MLSRRPPSESQTGLTAQSSGRRGRPAFSPLPHRLFPVPRQLMQPPRQSGVSAVMLCNQQSRAPGLQQAFISHSRISRGARLRSVLAIGLGSSLLHGSFIPEGLMAFWDTLSSRPKLEHKRPGQTTKAHVKTLVPRGVYCLLVESIGQSRSGG